jgi:hypothetical protein
MDCCPLPLLVIERCYCLACWQERLPAAASLWRCCWQLRLGCCRCCMALPVHKRASAASNSKQYTLIAHADSAGCTT